MLLPVGFSALLEGQLLDLTRRAPCVKSAETEWQETPDSSFHDRSHFLEEVFDA